MSMKPPVYRQYRAGPITVCKLPECFWVRWRERRGVSVVWGASATYCNFSERQGIHKPVRFAGLKIEALK